MPGNAAARYRLELGKIVKSLKRRHPQQGRSKAYHSWSFPRPSPPPLEDNVAMYGLPLLRQVVKHAQAGRPFLSEWPQATSEGPANLDSILTYQDVTSKAHQVSEHIRNRSTSNSTFIAHSTLPGSDYIACQWGSFAAGKASVPLSISQKAPEIEHVLQDSDPSLILASMKSPNYKQVVEAVTSLGWSDRIVTIEEFLTTDIANSDFQPQHLLDGAAGMSLQNPALLLYTSGTTGKPKGVLHNHKNLYHQITDLVAAWEWQPEDVALHLLPLHHVHGVVNILSCASYVGAQLQFQPFDAKALWYQWAQPSPNKHRIREREESRDVMAEVEKPLPKCNVLMAVPTIYAKLLEASKTLPPEILQQAVQHTLYPMRLQISGSAALPTSILHEWRQLTGHTLLERYGMTEFAMALSNPYNEVAAPRQPGHVGLPLPSVQVRIVDESTGEVIDEPLTAGALQVKGPTVFQEYWNRPKATAEAFTKDGYFDTGDVAEYNEDLESYRILGRASVDILKVGGHKISALEIERTLLEHPGVQEVVIVGIDDDTWGQRVGMIARSSFTANGSDEETTLPSLPDIQEWCDPLLSKHKIPTRLIWLEEIPKNAMGKVNKKELVHLFETNTAE